jgi:hypothetical protein
MKYIITLLIMLSFIACKKNKVNDSDAESMSYNSVTGSLVADTIIYEVIIKSTNPDDSWLQKSLGRLNRKQLIDSIFNLVYNKELTAYDYFSNEKLSVNQVRNMEREDGFNRDQIGMIQFEEAWYFNKSTQHFQKKVISIAMGRERFVDSTELRGYNPVFKIYLNP